MTENQDIHLTQRQRYWLNHIQQCKASGQSLRAYAETNGLNRNSLYTAHRKLKMKGVISSNKPAPKFQRLTVQRISLPPSVKITCPNGFVIESHAEAASLQSLLQMVSSIH
jgi:lambda repressor-like predicted transcriptional regulator